MHCTKSFSCHPRAQIRRRERQKQQEGHLLFRRRASECTDELYATRHKKKFHRAHCITHEENTTKAWTKRLRPCGGERAGSRCRDDTMLFSKALLLLFESHAYSRKRVALWLPAKVRLGGHRDGRGREAGFASALCFLSAETAIVLHLSLREAFFKPRG